MIDVAFCIDAEFWHPLLITISSLLFTNPESHFRLFVVSGAEVSAAEQSRLSEIIEAAGNATFNLITSCDSKSYGHLPVHGHLSLATYLRLFMTDFLPSSVDKVIYLDSDVLVRTNHFEQLWNIELGDAYLGAALEPFDPRQRLPLGFGPKDFYFNAGVMVVNVRKWREKNVLPLFLDFAERNRSILYSPDQDILNSVFRGEVVDIGVHWNWQALFPRLTPMQLHISDKEFAIWKRAPGIVHFTSRYKPWSWRWAPHYQQEYLRLLNKGPWRLTRPDKHLKHLPTKLNKVFQRFLEWHYPALARALRETRRLVRRSF
jgi:lipopolysaccharide biosynthesis glycosyltransferase